MPAKIYYDKDADLCAAEEQDDRHPGLRLARPRPRPEPPRQRLQRDRGRTARHGQLRAGRQGRLQADLGRRGRQEGRHHHHPAARRTPGRHLPQPDPRQPLARQRAGLLARLQRPFRPVRRAQGRVDDPRRPERPRPPGPGGIRSRGGVPCLIALGEGAGARRPEDRPGLRQGHRRHPRPA